MSEQLDERQFTGAHPTMREFVDQLTVWGFTRRKDEGVHLVLRGPRGGTLRVLRSLLGRADADLVEKAARLVGLTVEQFWAGPTAQTGTETGQRVPATRDRIVSLVLAAHTTADR